jgi:hypothetical protein
MARIPTDWYELLRSIHATIGKEIERHIAPWTRGGKLDLSSPNIVGHLPASRGGTGGSTGIVPDPFVYLIDSDGEYLIDSDGAFLYELEA